MDDKIRLALEILGAADAKELAAQVRAMKSAFAEATPAATKLEQDTYELADAYEVLGDEARGVFTSAAKVGEAMRAQAHAAAQATAALTEVTAATEREAAATAKATRETEKAAAAQAKLDKAAAGVAGKGLNQARQGFVDLSRALQDFAQGGFGGILNNLEGIGRAIPALLKNPLALLTSIPAILTTVGTALFIFGPKVYDAFRGFAFGANEIPRATDALGKIDGPLKTTTKRLEELASQHSLTNKELAEYNRLSTLQVELEKKKADEQQRQADLKKLNELKAAGVDDDAKERARMLQESLGGQQKDFIKAIAASFDRTSLDKALERLRNAIKFQGDQLTRDPFNLTKMAAVLDANVQEAQKKLDDVMKRRQDAGAELARRVMIQGDPAAMKQLQGMMAGNPGRFTDFQRFAVENADPAARRKEANDVAQKARMDRLDADLKKKADDAAAKADKDAKDAADKDRAALAKDFRPRNLAAGPAAIGPGKAPAGKVDNDRAREAQRTEALARQIFDRSRALTGQQFTPDQSRATAAESLKAQKQGIDINKATFGAMGKTLQTMAKLDGEMGQLQQVVANLTRMATEQERRTAARQRNARKR